MKRRDVEISYRRESSQHREHITCKACDAVLPTHRKYKYVKTIHIRCHNCDEPITVET